MRLLNVKTYGFEEFLGETVEPYGILSHTWIAPSKNEVTYGDMLHPEVAAGKPGFRKIEHCCRQAQGDGLKWIWVDTCCIDKTSSVELSEAINSMFRWYRDAEICYAYLSDVDSVEQLQTLGRRRPSSQRLSTIVGTSSSTDAIVVGKWFRRSWTLQELLAPRDVRFYGTSWQFLGTKDSLTSTIAAITGIGEDILCHRRDFCQVPAATRMHWASQRVASRVEDEAYSLLGLFGVNMPLLYGEGPKAFQRLQQKILKQSEDCTLLLWNSDTGRDMIAWDDGKSGWTPQPILASKPADFAAVTKPGFAPVPPGHFRDFKMTTPERGLRMNLLRADDLLHISGSASSLFDASKPAGRPAKLCLGLLNCAVQSQMRDDRDDRAFVAIVLRPRYDTTYLDVKSHSSGIYERLGPGFFVIPKSDFTNRKKWRLSTVFLAAASAS